jgi:hypothetical protein
LNFLSLRIAFAEQQKKQHVHVPEQLATESPPDYMLK